MAGPCCKVKGNLRMEGEPKVSMGYCHATRRKLKLVTSVSRCAACGARHYLSQAEPVHVGVKGGG